MPSKLLTLVIVALLLNAALCANGYNKPNSKK